MWAELLWLVIRIVWVAGFFQFGFVCSCWFYSVVFFVLQSANTNKHVRDGEQVLDAEEFVMFYMNLMSRPEVKELFERYTDICSTYESAFLKHCQPMWLSDHAAGCLMGTQLDEGGKISTSSPSCEIEGCHWCPSRCRQSEMSW